MEMYLNTLDLWEDVQVHYNIIALPNNPTIAYIKEHKEKKRKNQKSRHVYLLMYPQ